MMITIHQRNQKVSSDDDTIRNSGRNTLFCGWRVKSYDFLTHKQVNFELFCDVLFFLPLMIDFLAEKIQCSAFISDEQFTNEWILNVKFLHKSEIMF